MLKQVTSKWETNGNLAVIYKVDNLLLFYRKEKDPEFKKGRMLSMEQADESKPYKATYFSKENIPSDAFMSLSFSWQQCRFRGFHAVNKRRRPHETTEIFATKLPPCAMVALVLDDMKDELNALGVTVESIDIVDQPQYIDQYGLQSTPTLIFEKDGEEVTRIIGYAPEEQIREALN